MDRDDRPWGSWETLYEDADCKVKRIVVTPGKRLSYQTHAKREEHWTIVKGLATVTLDGVNKEYGPGQVVDIPTGAAHRVENAGTDDLLFVEVQLGSYFGEDDIKRLEDDYGRA
ncbi:MAG: mannose-6-phosphate isomerase [Elusimicrobia bacterium]|nr:MAG: mannose-6-phosphate isomerase [Elusimicrobiota bacterium]